MAESYLVHGILHATILQAKELIIQKHHIHGHSNGFFKKLCMCCSGSDVIEELEDRVHIGKGHSRLYATIDFGIARIARTRIVEHEPANPVWNESFHLCCAYETEAVTITVKDDRPVGAEVVGRAHIPVSEILSGQVVEDWYVLVSDHNGKLTGGNVCVRLQFVDARKEPSWGTGVPGPAFDGVPYVFFKQLKGNTIRLYQDAHMLDHFLPHIYLEGRHRYEPTRCWEDIYRAIDGAQYLVYIAGWSVYAKITLIRDADRMIPGAEGVTLGELLKRKAEEGVRVLLLVWDDRTSSSVLKTNGLMQTHDEDTEAYFKGSNVNCVLCPRNPDDASSLAQGFEVGLMFTHHQKTVTVDAPIVDDPAERRTIVSFVGGIDLCDGRYDTQMHSLFRTLNNVHENDFHQPNFEGADLKHGGPREPWHDVHSRLEGPVAWDVLYNFEERWKKQGKRGMLLPINEINNIVSPESAARENDSESWNSQIFRSIDEGAVVGFPREPEDAAAMGLMSGKDFIFDQSIQYAYIAAIRRAKKFIYMENQYFLGSCASWSSSQDVGALQLIPMELTLKIVSKIEAGKRFAVYVVVPMWPEGVPDSGSVQAILDWQRLTMEMMYSRIAKALTDKRMHHAKATDYLNFFCLGNRERLDRNEYRPPQPPPPGSDYRKAQDNRRFMIYVHAKTMIVDDEYIIVGSANCNQRSMDGSRDTEIAHGSYQPNHLASSGSPPRGQIHGFRMSLWYEHTGRLDDEFLDPESLSCVRTVRRISEGLWDMYTGPEELDLPGHLLAYPITEEGGSVTQKAGFEFFPDTKALVKGTKSIVLPPILTT
eukprot:c43009_g1_i1 orf=809-3268(+)